MSSRLIRGVLSLSLWMVCGAASFAKEPPLAPFLALDVDSDQKLNLDEFLKASGEPNVLKRDFRMFDWNHDKRLTVEEFDAILFDQNSDQRGPVPDPLEEMLQRAVEQLDENFDEWDQNPDKTVEVRGFVQSFVLSFPDPTQASRLFPALTQDADIDKDHRVNREEARRFLEIQLGLLHRDGRRLHLPNGRVLRNGMFMTSDINRDLQIDRAEFHALWRTKVNPDQRWTQLDRDRNDRVDYDEFVQAGEDGVCDPIEQFRRWDTNLDALLDEQELLSGVPDADRALLKYSLPAFDADGDKQWTLWEFRQSPHGNPVLPWSSELVDSDRSGGLQFQEFTFAEGEFPLLRLIAFLRFDANRSGVLEDNEFAFRARPAQGLYRLNADGTGWKKVFSSSDYPVIGSPKISPDGKWIACDAIPCGQTGTRATKMLVMTVDGQKVRELGSGMMPNWSLDGKQLAFSFNNSVQLLNVETGDTRIVVNGAWGGQWSPDGEKIAFIMGQDLKIMDLETEQITDLVSGPDTPYHRIYWNFAWSADSRRISFMGVNRDGLGKELASVSVDQPNKLRRHYTGQREFSHNLAWSPDGKRIVFGMHAEKSKRTLLHELNPDGDGEPVLVKGPAAAFQVDDPCWHPDGSYIIVQGREGDEWTE